MDEADSSNDSDEQRIHGLPASRRRFLGAAGAAGLVAWSRGVTLGYGRQAETTFEFGGQVDGWQGRAPGEIEGETNPTLELEAGTEYEVVWENLDGQPHDFVVQDENGNELVGTETVDEQGETRSLTFTASEEMDQYVCTIHPSSMVGDLQVGEGGEQEDGEPGEGERFVPDGPSVGVQQVAGGPLANPVALRSVPGVENAHLVVDQPGVVYLLHDGELQDESFLDISDDVLVLEEARGGFDRPEGFDERGLLGFDFHPDFEENGRFYVRYSSRNPVDGDDLTGPGGREYPDEWDHVEVLSEFETLGAGAFAPADPDSERVLLEIPSPQFNHNGGEVVFGPDGYLYTSIGDGGDGNDTGVGHVEDWYDGNEGGNAQNVEANLLGSVLRIDVDEEGDGRPYGIPDDNPFVDSDGYDEIYAYGLRNPWRMSFDGDRLIAADVGQSLFEEVDVIENGGNYGWNVTEGFHCFDAADATSPPEDCPDAEPDEAPYDGSEFVDPVLEYPHQYQNQPVGISITGGYTYEGDEIDDLSGRYVFGEWSASFVEPQGRIFVASPEEDPGDGADETPSPTQEETPTPTPDGTPTPTGTPGEGKGEQEEPAPEEVDIPSPEEQPWQWEEVLIEGGENQQLNRFVQAFGRDAEGEVYVLASQDGRPEGTNGGVYRLVPAGEGEEVQQPDAGPTGGDGGDGGGDEGTPTPTPTEGGGDEAGGG